LSVTYPLSAIIPDLRITMLTNAIPTIRVNWSTNAPGWVLQHAVDPLGPWTTVATNTTYQTTVSQGGPRRFYRVFNP